MQYTQARVSRRSHECDATGNNRDVPVRLVYWKHIVKYLLVTLATVPVLKCK